MSTPVLILASNSPRRRELLDQVGISYELDPAHVDESVLPGEGPEEYVLRVAMDKAVKTALRHGSGLVLGADTVVVLDGDILGKPASREEAVDMLTRLSGRAHKVMTGVALVDALTGVSMSGVEVTEVRMCAISKDEVEAYASTGEPMDKAGAYGIQGRAALFVEGIDGDFFNVVGLPLAKLNRMLKEFPRGK
jgi:septum formation protein